MSNGTSQALLITNRHVLSPPGVGDAQLVQIITPGASLNDQTIPDFGQKSIAVAQSPKFVAHPDTTVDVAVMSIHGLPLLGTHQPFIKTIPVDMLINEPVLAQLDAIEQVTFIGYPNALHDTVNMTPIARRGWTATPISLDYDGQPKFLIDASVFPGSSGSPVLVVNTGGYTPRTGGLVMAGRIILLGIVSAVYQQAAKGELVPALNLPKVTVHQAMNLGIVYKARSILEAIDHFLSVNGLSRQINVSETPVSGPVDPPEISPA